MSEQVNFYDFLKSADQDLVRYLLLLYVEEATKREILRDFNATMRGRGKSEVELSFIPMAHENKPTLGSAKDLIKIPDDFDEPLAGFAEYEPSVWVCTNHSPGSEVQVEKGKSCYCGRAE
jgi:hypothetical protein